MHRDGCTMEHVLRRDDFWEAAPAAPQIFSYVASEPVLRQLSLEFEYGLVDRSSSRAVAKFSCADCASCHSAVVWVSALTQLDGTWILTHAIGSME